MLNWDDPLSNNTAQANKARPAEPQTLAESYAQSEVLDGISFDDTGVTLPEIETENITSATVKDATVNDATVNDESAEKPIRSLPLKPVTSA